MPTLDNVSNQVGIGNVGGLGQTAAWGDFNGDGQQDLIIANTDLGSRNVFLFRNNGDGTFSDVTVGSGIVNQPLRSAAWADFDNDGLLDLVVGTTGAGAPPILYKNVGGGVFVDVSNETGIIKEGGVIGHVLWVDYDGDGRVDIFQANSGVSFLYHNEGGGKFKEVSVESGLGGFNLTNSAIWFDYNNDGFPDLFLADNGLNKLYKNNGDGTFTDITNQAGVGGDQTWNSVAACVGDFNNDGFLDLYVVNISSSRNALYINKGNGTFTDVTEETETQDVGDGRTCAWVDFDGDGWIDLFTTNHLSPTRLFRNLGNGKFKDVASQVGDFPEDVFAAPWGDFDRDGFIDVFLNGHGGTALMENSGIPNNFLIIKLIGDGLNTNISAIGTRVRVSTSSGIQIREVSGGKGCCEQDMLPLHFGVGREKEVDILVKWTGGKECPFNNVDIEGGRMFSISEDGCSKK